MPRDVVVPERGLVAFRHPLASSLAPQEAVLWLRGDTRPFALCGDWFGGLTMLGSEPVSVADPSIDPFRLLDQQPELPPGDVAVGGGWVGWLRFQLGARIEDLPPPPPAPLRRPPFSLAFYDHVVLYDGERWWFEGLCSDERQDAPRVWHLVSTVRGQLREGVGDGGLLRATFPPGSVTGAPKVQAMKVISELEATSREVYTGAIGIASPLAGLDLSVVIRTFELAGASIWMGAGGGIVADSDPQMEYDEALAKAAGPIAAIGGRLVKSPTTRVRLRPAVPDALQHGRRPDPGIGVFETVLVERGKPAPARRASRSARGRIPGGLRGLVSRPP
jgi:hypothetical protein